jgi:hypothetical protein
MTVVDDDLEDDERDVNREEYSLFVFSPRNRFRRICTTIQRSKAFRAFILTCVVINSIFLAADEPGRDKARGLETAILASDITFSVIFSVECIVKIVSLGFVLHKGAYLRSGWNCFDLLVLLLSLLGIIAGNSTNVSALRVFRVLRTLRSVKSVKQLRTLISALLDAIPEVANNMLLYFFILVLFAISGVVLFSGDLTLRCYAVEFLGNVPPRPANVSWANMTPPMLIQNDEEICGGTRKCANLTDYGIVSSCLALRDLYYRRNLNFDQLGAGLLLTLKVMTLDDWNDDLADLMNANGQAASLWFVVLTFVGSFICVNLFLAILTQAYRNRVIEQMKEDNSTQVTDEMLDAEYEAIRTDFFRRSRSIILSDRALLEQTPEVFAAIISAPPPEDEEMRETRFTPTDRSPSTRVQSSRVSPIITEDPTSKSASGRELTRVVSIIKQPSSRTSSRNRNSKDKKEKDLTTNTEMKPVKRRKKSRKESNVTGAAGEDVTFSTPPLQLTAQERRRRRIDDEIEAAVAVEQALAFEQAKSDALSAERMSCCSGVSFGYIFGLDDSSIVVHEEGDDRAPWRRRLAAIIDSIAVQIFMTVVTLVNVITLAVDYHGIDESILRAMDLVSVVCTALYTLNLILTVAGEGFARTFRSGLNVIDLLVIILSIPDVVLSGESSAWGVFRVIRLVRLMRFLRIRRLQPIVRTIVDSVSSIGFLSLLILLFLYVFSVSGMQIFGTDYGSGDPSERNSFGTIWQSAIVTFIAITGENWTTLMRIGMASFHNGGEIIPVVFFVVVYMVGAYILVNLSVAIILDSLESKLAIMDFANEEVQAPLLMMPLYVAPKKARLTSSNMIKAQVQHNVASANDAGTPSGSPTIQRRKSGFVSTLMASPLPDGTTVGSSMTASPLNTPMGRADAVSMMDTSTAGDNHSTLGHQQVLFADTIRDKESSFTTRFRKIRDYLSFVRPMHVEGESFFVFTPENRFRQVMITCASSTLFDRIIDFIIFVNIVFLLFESSKNSDQVTKMLRTADYIFTSVFAGEMLIKMIAFGVMFPRSGQVQKDTGFVVQEAYLRDMWNWVDFIVVVSSVVAYFVPLFRASRALRALRLMTRYENTKIIVMAVLQAIPHVLQSLVFVSVVFFVLGVMGVKFFKGRYYTCNDPSIVERDLCVGHFTDYVQGPIFKEMIIRERSWDRRAFHFDHLGSALLTLFVVMVGDGWTDIMFDGMDTDTSENWGLQRGNREYMSLYFITVYITCNLFALNMMIGVLVSYFSKKKRLHDGSALLTPAQRMYVKARYAIDATLDDDQIPRESRAAVAVDYVLNYRYMKLSTNTSIFDLAMMVVIIINTVMIAATHEGMPDALNNAINVTSNVALAIFCLEALLKLFAYGLIQYFSFAWNCFDFIIVLVGIIGAIVNLPGLSVFRVLRVFKMIKGSGVEKLLISLIRGLSSFVNVTAILLLTFFVFAVAGVILFGKVKPHGSITVNYNFENVPNAILTLYTVATGSGWAEVMDACGLEPPNCDPHVLDNCGTLPGSVAFFVIFMVACAFIVLQLFVAVVVEIFLDDVNLKDPVIKAFGTMKEQWNEKFGAGTRSVPVQDFCEILKELPSVLTDFTWDATKADVLRFLGSVQLPVDSNFHVQYVDVVNAVAFRKFKVDLRSMAKYVNDTVVSVFGTRAFTATQAVAILVIQRAWRRRKAFLADTVVPLTGISTVAWLQRVAARRQRKAEKSTGSSADSLHLLPPLDVKPVRAFSEVSASYVPTGGILVPGSMLYAFPMPDLGGVALSSAPPAMSDVGTRSQARNNAGGQLSPAAARGTTVDPRLMADPSFNAEVQIRNGAPLDADLSPGATSSDPNAAVPSLGGADESRTGVSSPNDGGAESAGRDDSSVPAMSFEGTLHEKKKGVSFTFGGPTRPTAVSGTNNSPPPPSTVEP